MELPSNITLSSSKCFQAALLQAPKKDNRAIGFTTQKPAKKHPNLINVKIIAA
jgi:hypothetical protein